MTEVPRQVRGPWTAPRPLVGGVLAAVAILSGLITAHILIAKRGDTYSGVLFVADHLFSLALVLGLFAIAAGVGGRLLKAGGLRMEEPLEALLFWTALGLGALATAILAVGLFFSVRPGVLYALLVGAVVVGRNELRELPTLVRGAIVGVRTHADRFSLSIFLVVAAFLLTGALAPPTDWDALMYHLRLPEQFLRAGAIYLPEDNAHFAFVGLPHMLYLPLLAFGSEAGPALVSALCTLGLALAVFAFARRFLDQRTAGFSLSVIWGSTVIVLVAISPRTDTILAFYLFLVQYAVIWATQSEDPRLLYLAAALGGMAIGIKYNALVYLLSLAPLAVWVVITRVRQRTLAVALILGLVLVGASPWLLKNGLLLGDPMYPFIRGRTLDPWLAQIYGGGALPHQLDAATFNALWHAQKPFNLLDLFTAPGRLAVEEEGRFYRPNLLLLCLPLWLLFVRHEVLGWLGGPALAYVVLVVVLQPTTSLRYLIPAIAPLTLVALHSYGLSWDKVLSSSWVRRLLRATALVVLTGTAWRVYGRMIRGPQLAYMLGSVSRHAFLTAETGDYVNVVSFVNSQLSKQSRMLMLFEARGYYFRIPVLQDNVIMNWPLLSARASSLDCLRSVGITHVLVNTGVLQYYAHRGVDLGPLRLDSFRDFARGCLSPIYSRGGFTVFRVNAERVRESASGPP